MRLRRPLLGLALVVLAACGDTEPAPPPPPVEVTGEATGHYCGMLLQDHEGPKGQIHLVGRELPIWFSSVRDTIVFTRLPEEPKNIAAIYVNDMGKANWEQPEPGTWIEARQAWFVIGSRRMGGMGMPEAIPFSDRVAAMDFAATHGGTVTRLDEIPDSYVLGPVEAEPGSADDGGSADHGGHATH